MKRCKHEEGELVPCQELAIAIGKTRKAMHTASGIHIYHRQVRYKRGPAQVMPHVFNFCPFCGAELKWWD